MTQRPFCKGVSVHWTGLLDWNTALDYFAQQKHRSESYSALEAANLGTGMIVLVRIGMAPGGATSVTYHATRSMDGTPDQRQTAHRTKWVGLIHKHIPCVLLLISSWTMPPAALDILSPPHLQVR